MITIEGDRRRHPRSILSQPCKIFDPHSGKYIGGKTLDLSPGGALIDLPRVLAMRPGDTLHIGVAMKRRQGLIHSAQMIRAAVMRTLQTVDDHTLIGLRFDEPVHAQDEQRLRAAA